MTQLSFSSFDSSLLVRDAQGRYLPASVDQILDAARQVIDQKIQRGMSFTSPTLVKEYLCAKLAGFEHEVFAVLFLDSQHRLIDYTEMFRGTIDGASVYPREVVKEALRLNAAAVIFLPLNPRKDTKGKDFFATEDTEKHGKIKFISHGRSRTHTDKRENCFVTVRESP